MKILISTLFLFSSIANLKAQSNWTFVEESYIKGSISGVIKPGHIFKVSGVFYVSNNQARQRVHTNNPNVKIYQNGSAYKLVIEDFEEPVICEKIKNVIETQILGEFNGWDGETTFNMLNGQIWQQSSYAYLYHYAFMPKVLIYKYKGSWILKVEGVEETIQVWKRS